MKIHLTPQESEKYFYNALCNGASGLSYSGCSLDYRDSDYGTAHKNLELRLAANDFPHEMCVSKNDKPSICREDVWMQILKDGNKLTIKDHEGAGEYTRKITLADVHERVQNTPIHHLNDMINENDQNTANNDE